MKAISQGTKKIFGVVRKLSHLHTNADANANADTHADAHADAGVSRIAPLYIFYIL